MLPLVRLMLSVTQMRGFEAAPIWHVRDRRQRAGRVVLSAVARALRIHLRVRGWQPVHPRARGNSVARADGRRRKVEQQARPARAGLRRQSAGRAVLYLARLKPVPVANRVGRKRASVGNARQSDGSRRRVCVEAPSTLRPLEESLQMCGLVCVRGRQSRRTAPMETADPSSPQTAAAWGGRGSATGDRRLLTRLQGPPRVGAINCAADNGPRRRANCDAHADS